MTREEEIRNKAVADQRLLMESADWRGGFISGANWADGHPNLYNDEKYHTVKVSCLDELNRKAALHEEFLEKACGWLKDWDRKTMYELSMIMGSNFIEDFRKVIEEE